MRRPWLKVLVYCALGLAVVVTLMPLFWLITANLKGPRHQFQYIHPPFLPPLSKMSVEDMRRLLGSSEIGQEDIKERDAFCKKLTAAGATGRTGPALRLWSLLGDGSHGRIRDHVTRLTDWEALDASIRAKVAGEKKRIAPEERAMIVAGLARILAQEEYREEVSGKKRTFHAEIRRLLTRGPESLRAHARPLIARLGGAAPAAFTFAELVRVLEAADRLYASNRMTDEQRKEIEWCLAHPRQARAKYRALRPRDKKKKEADDKPLARNRVEREVVGETFPAVRFARTSLDVLRRDLSALSVTQAGHLNRLMRGAKPDFSDEDTDFVRADLNRLLARRDLYDGDSFKDVNFTFEARQLIDRNAKSPESLSTAETELMNRLILEEAFPGEVAQNQARIPYLRYMMNSFFVSGMIVLIQLFFSSLGGFALAKYEFAGKRLIMVLMLGTMMIPQAVLLAPMYELIFRLGFTDSHAGLIVPAAVSVFGMFLFRQSMMGIPDELLEAGRIDGCSEFGIYWNVVLPVSRPMIGAFCLISFMGNWNSFLWPQIILHTRERFTLPIGLNQLVGQQEQIYGVLMAGTLLAIVPVMILFFIFQREFISGLTAGAVKG